MDLNKVFATVQEASRKLLSLSDKEINQILLAVADAALAKSDYRHRLLTECRKLLAIVRLLRAPPTPAD